MSVSKIHRTTTHMFNGKVVVTRLINMLSRFPLSVSGELLRTAHTHLPSFPLTAGSLLFPSCSFVYPSQQWCPLQEQHAQPLIESNLQSLFSCILLKSPPPFPFLLSHYCVTVRRCGNTRSLFQEVSLVDRIGQHQSTVHQINGLFLLTPVPNPSLPGSRCSSGPKDVHLLSEKVLFDGYGVHQLHLKAAGYIEELEYIPLVRDQSLSFLMLRSVWRLLGSGLLH